MPATIPAPEPAMVSVAPPGEQLIYDPAQPTPQQPAQEKGRGADLNGFVPLRTEKTGMQVQQPPQVGGLLSLPSVRLTNPLPKAYETYRRMRKHPTIALGRMLSVAPVVSGTWTVEGDDDAPDEVRQFVSDQFLPIRPQIVESAMLGGIDFGWQAFELVYDEAEVRNDKTGEMAKRVVIRKFKPLLPDITWILIDMRTGAYTGLQNRLVLLDPEYTMTISFRVEGTQWYGTALLENIREMFNEWMECNEGASRYDRKVAGSHILVHYPVGADGASNNFTSGMQLLNTLESSGGAVIPNTKSRDVESLGSADPAWIIEMLEDKGGRQPEFVDRLRYLDVQMIRGLLFPERAILEGEFGTKAESSVHTNLALAYLEQMHTQITRHVNAYAVDRLLVLNWGEEMRGKVYLQAAPLVDSRLAYLRSIYDKILSSPQMAAEEFPTINSDALKDLLQVPKATEIADHQKVGSENLGRGLTPEQLQVMRQQIGPAPGSGGAR